MNRTLIAATAALATLAGTTSALAQEGRFADCAELLEFVQGKVALSGNVTLTDPERTIECNYEFPEAVDTERQGVDGRGVAADRLGELLGDGTETSQGTAPAAARPGLQTAFEAVTRNRGGDGEAQEGGRSDRAGQGAANAETRGGSGNRPTRP